MLEQLAAGCLCGFTPSSDDQVGDHLLEAFGADGGTGTDGRTHEEVAGQACTCGHKAANGDRLDQHFIAMFTPDNGTGLDGAVHAPIGAPGRPFQ